MTRSTRTASSAKSRRPATAKVARPAWRKPIDQALELGQGALTVVQQRGTAALEVARRQGESITLKAREAAEQRLEGVAVKVIGAWDQVEQAASERVGRTLNRLGVPSQKDIERLTKSVAKLSSQIDKLSTAAAKPTAAPKAAPTKAAAPKAAPKAARTATPRVRRTAAPVVTEAAAS
jgi:poly(hydroxyalkanoate) granule-associated protein